MRKKVVTIGGGGGHSAVVASLKDLDIQLTVLCNTVDDGGGSGKLMRDYGVHSPGDFRRILSTLAQKNGEVLNYRFSGGQYTGQTISNLLLAGLELSNGSFQKGLDTLREWFGISQVIAPITEETPVLHAKTLQGEEVHGQANIVKYVRSNIDPIATVWLEPREIELSSIARHALIDADIVVVSMGDLYSSIAPFFCLKEVQEMWGELSAKTVWLPNVAITPGHIHYKTTSGAMEFLQTLTPLFIPDIIVAHEGELSEELKKSLKQKGYGVSELDVYSNKSTQVIKQILVEATVPEKQDGDPVDRSPILYNTNTLKNIFQKILV